MSVLDIVGESFIDTDVIARKKEDVFPRIAELAKQSKALRKYSADEIVQALIKREKLGTTGFGGGIAIPHCAFPDLDDFVVGFCRVREGVKFDALDGKPVYVLFFIIGPEGRRNTHIQILSTISKILADEKNVSALRTAGATSEVMNIIKSEQGPPPDVEQVKERCIFHILVQREEYFDKVMQILSAEVQGEIAVMEAHNAGYYLHRMPLFSAYWGEDSGKFTRLIIAVADKGVCNDIIRRIYLIDDDINRKGGILVTAQDLLFAGGSLDL
ncbi:MAG: PTS sugar transporter subunit IIA [Spirochaetales bacterium]|jgi:nitrogen PTS system EIIA component|nr:PTS sugar transporter subunit IIA [Spirochaetales bacterium]